MRAFGVTHSDRSPLPILDFQLLDHLMTRDAAGPLAARHIEQIMDAVPQHMFILEPMQPCPLSILRRANTSDGLTSSRQRSGSAPSSIPRISTHFWEHIGTP